MKNNTTLTQLKKIAMPSLLYITLGFAFIFLIKKSIILTLILEGINYLLYLFVIYIKLRGYKLKYFFLGRRYKEDLKICMRYLTGDSKEAKKFICKWSKDKYRREGTLLQNEIHTPFGEMWGFYDMWLSCENEDDDIFILCVIYDYLNSSGSLYRIFEQLSHNFTYEEYKQRIAISNLYSNSAKEILLDAENEDAYNAIKREETAQNYNRTEKDDEILSQFEANKSDKLNQYLGEINETFEKKAIQLYLEKYKMQGLPINLHNIFFTADNRNRIYFSFDDKKQAYKISEDKFEFDNPQNELHSRGYWVATNTTFGIYESKELAKKDILDKLKNFTEYTTKK